MSLKSWLIKRAAAHYIKEIAKMKPLPKWAGLVTWILTNAGAIYAGYAHGGLTGAIIALVTVLTSTGTLVAHSITGTGGTPKNP